MSALGRKETRLVLGGVPRVDLLPPEVALSAKARVLHRGLSLVVVAAMLVVGAGYGAASLHATNSNAQLAAATARTQSLLAQQQKYIEVGKVTSDVKLVTAARQVGSSTDIDWQAYLKAIAGSLPPGTTVVKFRAASGSPLAEFEQPIVPLQGERIAELTFEATSDSLPNVQSWLNALATLTGFVDAAPGTVTFDEKTSTYKAGITMHINEQALTNRYVKDAVKATDTKAKAGDGTGTATEASTEGGK